MKWSESGTQNTFDPFGAHQEKAASGAKIHPVYLWAETKTATAMKTH